MEGLRDFRHEMRQTCSLSFPPIRECCFVICRAPGSVSLLFFSLSIYKKGYVHFA